MAGSSSAAIRRPRRDASIEELLPRLRQTLEESRRLQARFAALSGITGVVGSSSPLADKLSATLELLRGATRTSYALIALLSDRGDRFTHEVLSGFDPNSPLKSLVVDRLANSVAMEGVPLLIPRTLREVGFPELRAHAGALRSLALVPIGTSPRVVGVLGVLSGGEGSELGQDEIDFLTIAATQLESIVRESTSKRLNFDTVVAVVRSLTAALEARDSYTRGHSERVAKYSLAIVHELEIAGVIEHSIEFRNTVRLAAFLHDIGKIGISDLILQKPGGLSAEEFDEIKKHTLKGAQIIEGIPELIDAVPGVLSHHERLDGKGYPHGLSGNDIPLLGKIIGTADAFDAMTTDRPYKKGVPHEQAIEIIRGLGGTQFDPTQTHALASAQRSGLLEEGGLDTGSASGRVAQHPEIERIFSREIHDLPALPQIITQILERTRDPKCPVREIVRLISHDQALVIKMLRLVNSAFYGFSRKITTINLAVAILGYRVVQNVVLNIGVVGVFREIMKARDERRVSLFEHSIECAVLSKAIAAKIPRLEVQQDEAFTAGLLHDVGKIVLDQYARETVTRVQRFRAERGLTELEAETAVLGFDHAQIGEWIATRWNIPIRLREAILYHHRPFASLEKAPSSYTLVRVVAIADAIYYLCRETQDAEEIGSRLAGASLSEAGLDTAVLTDILATVEHEKRELQQTLAPADGA